MSGPEDPPTLNLATFATFATFAIFANFEGFESFIGWQEDHSGTLRPVPFLR